MFLHIYSAQRFMSQKHRSCFLWSFSQISDHCWRQPDTRQTSRQQNNTTRIPSWSNSINELLCHDSWSSIIWLCLVWWNNSFFFFIYVARDPQTPTSNDGKISLSSVFYLLDMNTWQSSLRDVVQKINEIFLSMGNYKGFQMKNSIN